METLEEFISRLTERVRCFYHKCKSERYSLKKTDTNLKGRMGVFAWVEERKKDNKFVIENYKILGDKSNVTHLTTKLFKLRFTCLEKRFWTRNEHYFLRSEGQQLAGLQESCKSP